MSAVLKKAVKLITNPLTLGILGEYLQWCLPLYQIFTKPQD